MKQKPYGNHSSDCACRVNSREIGMRISIARLVSMGFRWNIRRPRFYAALACGLATAMAAGLHAPLVAQSAAGHEAPASSQAAPDDGLVIEPGELPTTYPQAPYHVFFHAHGNYVPVLQWKIAKGALPPGITLNENGTLHGAAQRAGEFEFVVVVRDGSQPQQAVQKTFAIKVLDAMTIDWKVPAHVNVSRIEGSVEVTNATADDMDLTFDVKAVADNGRATEIGYQHFVLTKGTMGMALPFGESLPHGGYVVYVNVVGEVAKRNVIYKQQMKTPAALQVIPGP
jgi:hypothetical protein